MAAEIPKNFRTVIVAASVGNVIEWYDFYIFGSAAAFLLFALRMVQGFCLGGEYGGAITYVAEHVSDERRGYYTGWLQTSPTLGIVVALAVVLASRGYFGEEVFNAWAWRVPF